MAISNISLKASVKEFHVGLPGADGTTIRSNGSGHATCIRIMTTNGKNLKKASCPEPIE